MVRLSLFAASLLLGVSISAVQATTAAHAPSSTAADANAHALLIHDFTVFDPQVVAEATARGARLHALKADLTAEEVKGIANVCAHQIFFEAGTLLLTNADFKRIDRRIDDLTRAIAHPSADKQDADGMWGSCSEQWFLKFDNTYDHLQHEARDRSSDLPRQPLPAFLACVSTPAKLTAYLDSVSVSDVQHTGVDHGLEFNLAVADFLRMIVLGEPQRYKIDPALRDAFLERLMGAYRNHQTGFWGERYRRDGREDFVDDISTTFHIVSYLKGQVPDMPLLLDTLLAVKNLNAPAGWLQQGQYWNHNNVDVITEFRYAWPTASTAQRQEISTEIEHMLAWCLKDSLQPDGSFKLTISDPSMEYAEYFGTAFLTRIGFFNPSLRFWTNRDFPESTEVRHRIEAFIQQHKAADPDGDNYRDVTAELNDH
jgi:hypothetical protein